MPAAVTPLAAQQAIAVRPADGNDYTRAVAAGYKAAMLCSGIFVAGKTDAQVERDELSGIYPDYQALVRTLPATVDRRTGTVTVRWSQTMPPRRAEWAGGRGCATMPIGAAPVADGGSRDRAAPEPRARRGSRHRVRSRDLRAGIRNGWRRRGP
jgi:hypothetical protein